MNDHNDITADNRSYVRELQDYLRVIERERTGGTNVPADGFYGSRTADAVRDFQRLDGLPVTGVTDRKTWDDIYTVYTEISALRADPTAILAYRAGQPPLRVGVRGDSVWMLQVMLGRLCRHYAMLPPAPVPDGAYSAATAAAVQALQKTLGLAETGITDKLTWDRITSLFNRE